jgi:hypothetical protein
MHGRREVFPIGVSTLLASALWALPALADEGAGLEACGSVFVEVRAECVLVPPGAECQAMCEPVSVEAACSVELAADCRAQCDELPSARCTADCHADCEANCEIDPGEFDCETACGVECSGSCAGQCRNAANETDCESSCEGSCSASCKSRCNAEPPSASCQARCDAGCTGSCEVHTNLDCQLECQADGHAECLVDVEGGCEVQCERQEGALFCNGQYVDYGNNLDACLEALQAALNVTVETSGESRCEGDTCTATGRARVNSDCSVTLPGQKPGRSTAAWWLLPGLCVGLLALRRRRSR